MTQPRIEHAQIHWNDAGTPVSDNFDDVYFSNANGLEETRYVFLHQNHLPARWQQFDRDRFVIAETGFGTGLNFLAVWQEFEAFRDQNPDAKNQQLHFISFEKFPVTQSDLEKAHAAWPELAEYAKALRKHYPAAVSGCHRIVLADGMVTLDLWFGDIKDCMPQVWTSDEGIVDCWFLDGFAPSKNPEMWSQSLFDGMARLARESCTVATFTAAGFVRRGLIDAGFDMKKTKGFGTKRDMIVGHITKRHQPRQQAPWYKRNAPTVSGNESLDVAIVGGGVASATLAISLVRRGKHVTLYCEHDKPGHGASGNRQGAVYPLLNGSNDALSRFFAPAFLFSRQFVEQAAETVRFDHDWCGVTQLGWDEKSADKLAKMLKGGFPDEVIHALTAEDTATLTNIETRHGGVSYPLGGWLCPQQLTQGLIEQAQATGLLTCHYNTDITRLTHENDQWTLSTDNDNAFCHHAVVIANGHRFTQFEQTASIPAYSVRGQVSHINTTPVLENLKTVLCYDGYLTPVNTKNGTHCIGASYSRNDESLDFRMDDQVDNKQRLVDCVPSSWPKDVNTDHGAGRVGVRCASRDHLPYVGDVCDYAQLTESYSNLRDNKDSAVDVPVYPNLFSILALGSRGLTSAPLLGELMASQICGHPLPLPTDVLDALHPGRMWVRKLLKGKAL